MWAAIKGVREQANGFCLERLGIGSYLFFVDKMNAAVTAF